MTKQHIVVTGGSGKLGSAVIRELLAAGHQVFNLDQQAPAQALCRYMRTDFRDFGQCVDALGLKDVGWDHADTLVHLAAIPGHSHAPDAHLFANNLNSSFNLWRAAHTVGIRDIVWASSETLLGVPFERAPQRLPLDETISLPESSYSLVKHLEEAMAAQFCRQDPQLKMVGLRFSYVHDDAQLQALRETAAERSRTPRHQAWNLWSYISARDAAVAVRLAIEQPARGLECLLIANPDTIMPQPTRELLAQVFPGLAVPDTIQGHQSVMDCSKAQRVLGWTARHGWR